jgi:hypothetical protein
VHHWTLSEVETPQGARSPVVLHSKEGAERAVLIELRGSLFHFDPDERHSVTSDEGARLLLLLAPWTGEGHYRGERPAASGVSAS